MAQPLILPLPPNLELWDGCIVRVTALNPATGAAVAGVEVSAVTLEVDPSAGSSLDLGSGPFMLVPGPGA